MAKQYPVSTLFPVKFYKNVTSWLLDRVGKKKKFGELFYFPFEGDL